MNRWDTHLQSASEHVFRHASKVLSRDNAHLSPRVFSPAAAARFKAGLRAIEAYLCRMILWLALQIEHDLPGQGAPRATSARRAKLARNKNLSLKIFTGQTDVPDFLHDRAYGRPERPKTVLAAPYLARKRPGLMLAPDTFRAHVPSRYGTELSASYKALGKAIIDASRARPPPLGPPPRHPPRIRYL
ncbi:MAG: hypothetical protein P8H62_06890 [Henriciella sp.]|nr:hypothetical protein [Henriciella sp.]